MAMITATASHQEKKNWLIWPLEWALNVVLYSAVLLAGIWLDPTARHWALGFTAVVALISLTTVSGLLIWGLARLSNVAKGYDQ